MVPSVERPGRARARSVGRGRAKRSKVIVWATDGSEGADAALSYARNVAHAEGAELVAVHVDEFVVGRGGGYSVNVDEDRIRARIVQQVKQLKGEGLEARLYIARSWAGGVARAVAAIAKAVKADLVILGKPKRGFLYGLLAGSMTRSLMRIASCPVLVVPATSARA